MAVTTALWTPGNRVSKLEPDAVGFQFLCLHFFIDAAQLHRVADMRGANVDFAHVVDSHSDAQPLLVVEDVVEQHRFAGAQKTGKNT